MKSLFFITLLALFFALAHAQCDTRPNCTECLNHKSCGWCADWNGCLNGDSRGPYNGNCNSWHTSTCVGVSLPKKNTCNGPPISQNRIRQLMGAGGDKATIAGAAKWSLQHRACNPVTGCNVWNEIPTTAPATNATLHVWGNTVSLDLITGICEFQPSYCNGYNWLTSYSRPPSRYGLAVTGVGQPALTFAVPGIPVVKCSSVTCNSEYWRSPNGVDQFIFSGTLTDNCLQISGMDRSSPPIAFIELYFKF